MPPSAAGEHDVVADAAQDLDDHVAVVALSWVVPVAVMAGTVVAISSLSDSFAALAVGVVVAAIVATVVAGRVATRDGDAAAARSHDAALTPAP